MPERCALRVVLVPDAPVELGDEIGVAEERAAFVVGDRRRPLPEDLVDEARRARARMLARSVRAGRRSARWSAFT